MADFVITDQYTVGFATGRAVLFAVNFLKKLALVKIQRPINILSDFSPADVEIADFDVTAAFSLYHQVPETTPGRFKFLKIRVVDDSVQLIIDQMINN